MMECDISICRHLAANLQGFRCDLVLVFLSQKKWVANNSTEATILVLSSPLALLYIRGIDDVTVGRIVNSDGCGVRGTC